MGIFDDIPVRDFGDDVTPSWWNTIRTRLIQAFPNLTSVEGDVVGTTDDQKLTNKTFDDELTLKELEATPLTPGATYKKFYAKDDGKLYSLNSSGDEVEVGSGAGGGGKKNYFDADSAKFENGTIGNWLKKLEEDTTPYNVTTSDSNFALTSENTEEFSLVDERIDNIVIDIWRSSSDRDATLSIIEGPVSSPGATVWTTTVANASMATSQTTPTTYSTGLTAFLTGTYHTRIDQSAGTGNLITRADTALFGNPRTFTLNALRSADATNLTLVPTTTSGEVLEKTTSLKLTKAAADAENERIYLASQTIDLVDRGKTMYGSFAMLPISGYVSGDLILEVYDVTNENLLYSGQEEDREVLNVSDPVTFRYTASLETTTEQIELRLRVNNTNTNAFVMVFDEFEFGPAAQVNSAIVSGWQFYTPTLSASLNATIDFAEWRRVGENMDIRGVITTGTPTAGVATISLANGKVSASRSATTNIGNWRQSGSSIDDFTSGAFQLPSGGSLVTFVDDFSTAPSSGSPSSAPNANVIFRSSSKIYFEFSVPIEGWTSGQVLTENELSQHTIRVSGAGNGATSITANVTDIDFTEIKDSHGAWDGNSYTASKREYIRAKGFVFYTASGSLQVDAYINGAINKAAGYLPVADALVPFLWEGELQKGDVLSFRLSVSKTLSNDAGKHWIEISSSPDFTTLGVVKNKEQNEVWALTAVGVGSTATRVLQFSSVNINTGAAITRASDATNGDSFTINESGRYSITFQYENVDAGREFAITRNQVNLAQNPTSHSSNIPLVSGVTTANRRESVTVTAWLLRGDILRSNIDTNTGHSTGTGDCGFRVIKID